MELIARARARAAPSLLSTAGRARVSGMLLLLWLLAVVLVVAGVVSLIRGELVLGVILIIIGLLVGPGGVSIISR